LSACHKDYVAPSDSVKKGGGSTGLTTTGLTGSKTTAANDTTKGYMHVQLAMGNTATADIIIEFDPAASAVYSNARDARTFPGGGAPISLSSLSSDNVALAINQLPLVSSGTKVGLAVGAINTGQYTLNLTQISTTIPAAVQIWLKDAHNKDSLDFRRYPSYIFNINKSDSTTYGSHRFCLVLREK